MIHRFIELDLGPTSAHQLDGLIAAFCSTGVFVVSVVVASGAVGGHPWPAVLLFGLPLSLATALVARRKLRPRLRLEPSGVVVRRPMRTVRVPWADLVDVTTGAHPIAPTYHARLPRLRGVDLRLVLRSGEVVVIDRVLDVDVGLPGYASTIDGLARLILDDGGFMMGPWGTAGPDDAAAE